MPIANNNQKNNSQKKSAIFCIVRSDANKMLIDFENILLILALN